MAKNEMDLFGDVNLFALPKIEDPTAFASPQVQTAKGVELSAAARGYLQEGSRIGQEADALAAQNHKAISQRMDEATRQGDAQAKYAAQVQEQLNKEAALRVATQQKEAEKEAKATAKALEKANKALVKGDPAFFARPYVTRWLEQPGVQALGTEQMAEEFEKYVAGPVTESINRTVPEEYRADTLAKIRTMGAPAIAKIYKDRRSDGLDPLDLVTATKRAYLGLRSGISDKWFNEFEGIRTKLEKGETLTMGELQRLPDSIAPSRLPGGAPASGKLTPAQSKAAQGWLKTKSNAEITSSLDTQRRKVEADKEYSAGIIEARDNANYNDSKWQAANANTASGFRKATRGIGKTFESLGYSLVDSAPASVAIIAGTVATAWATGGAAPMTVAAQAFLSGQAVGMDAAEGARQLILDADEKDLKKLPYYDRFLKDSDGNVDMARKKLASYAGGDAYGSGELLGMVTSVFGPEALAAQAIMSSSARTALATASVPKLMSAMRSPAAKAVVARAAARGLIATGAEGAEEGATQMISNVTANKYGAGVDKWDGVAESVGAGLAIGGVMSTPGTIASGVQDYRSGRAVPPVPGTVVPPSPTGAATPGGNLTPAQLVDQFVDNGEVDSQALVERIYTDLQQATPEQRQAYYDLYYDSDVVQGDVSGAIPGVLTDTQKADLDARFRTSAYDGLNTNPYATAGVTTDQLVAQGKLPANPNATNPLTLDALAYDSGTAVAGDPILAEAVSRALKLVDTNPNTTTAGRTRSYLEARAAILAAMPDLTVDQIVALDQYAATALDATHRRMTDAETQAQAQQNAGVSRPSQNVGGPTPSSNNAGSGNNATPQAPIGQGAPGATVQGGQGVGGNAGVPNQTNPTGQVQNNAIPLSQPGVTATVTRNNGQANQGAGPTGPVGPDPAVTPGSGGSGGATQTERGADGQRAEATTETVNDLVGQRVNYGGIEGTLAEANGSYFVQPNDSLTDILVESSGPGGSTIAADLGLSAIAPLTTNARVQQALQQLDVLGHTDALSDVRKQIFAASLNEQAAEQAAGIPLTEQEQQEYVDLVFQQIQDYFATDEEAATFIMDVADAMEAAPDIDIAIGVENAFNTYRAGIDGQSMSAGATSTGQQAATDTTAAGTGGVAETVDAVTEALDQAALDAIAGGGKPTSEVNNATGKRSALRSKKAKPAEPTRRQKQTTKTKSAIAGTLTQAAKPADEKAEGVITATDKALADTAAPKAKPKAKPKRLVSKKSAINVSLSASTSRIPGLAELQALVDQGDAEASALLQNVAQDAMKRLLSGVASAKVSYNNTQGVYKGDREPSLNMDITFTEDDRPAVLAALAQFASNFNQEEVHVQVPDMDSPLGTTYGDGSFTTIKYSIDVAEGVNIDTAMEESGVDAAMTKGDTVELYYVGDINDANAIARFEQSAGDFITSVGASGGQVRTANTRLWKYGESNEGGRISYADIVGDVRTEEEVGASPTANRIAKFLLNKGNTSKRKKATTPANNQKITPEQQALQREIGYAYDAMPESDLDNPTTKQAYEELAAEVREQFNALPVKVTLVYSKDEPYANSTEMRRDVLDNNHLNVYATRDADGVLQFGSNDVDYSNHPMLEETDARDSNGSVMLVNDMFRAVHDYYAHTMSTVSFGPVGEEAAWKNHMSMMRSPLAAWALTTETRGQNSWVNFRDGQMAVPIQDRGFADQKTVLLPVKYMLTGNKAVDARLAGRLGEYDQNGTAPAKAPQKTKKLVSKKAKPKQTPKKLTAKPKKEKPTTPKGIVDEFPIKSFGMDIVFEDTMQKAWYILGSSEVKTNSEAHEAARAYVLEQGVDEATIVGEATGVTAMINTRAKVFKSVGGKGPFDPSMNMADSNLANLYTAKQVQDVLATLTPAERATFDAGVEYFKDNKSARNNVTETTPDVALVATAFADITMKPAKEPTAAQVKRGITYGLKPYKQVPGFAAVLQKIVDVLRKGVKSIAVVSMSLALAYGIASPNTSMAATPVAMTPYNQSVTADANAVNNYVQENNDTNGKPYVVADKRGGVVYLYDGEGNLINESPALFGREVSDATTTNSTPAGKFKLSYIPTDQVGYGGSVQGFATQGTDKDTGATRVLALHRVWTQNPAQNRTARLTSKTASDNRVSNGCINVPNDFYNANLDGKFDGFIYVIPETDNYTGNRFGTQANNAARTQSTRTGSQDTAPVLAEQQPAPTVSSEALADRQKSYGDIKGQVTLSPVPFTIEGTTPSTTQVALTEPVISGEVSHNTVAVPADTLTPAEEGIGENFDTLPITDVDAEGNSAASISTDIYLWLVRIGVTKEGLETTLGGLVAALGVAVGAGVYTEGKKYVRRRKYLANKRQGGAVGQRGRNIKYNWRISQRHANALAYAMGPSTTAPTPGQAPVPTIPTPPLTGPTLTRVSGDLVLDAEHRGAWYEFMQNSDQLTAGVEEVIDLAGTSLFVELGDKTKRQIINNLFEGGERRRWRDIKNTGLIFKPLNYFNGAKIHLDNWAANKKIPFMGVEQDTSVFSSDLSAMPSRSNAYAHWLEAAVLRPVGNLMQSIARQGRIDEKQAFDDLSEYVTLHHLLTEGFDRQIQGLNDSVTWLTERRDAVIREIANTTAPVSKRKLQNVLDKVKDELREAVKLARDTEAAINGTQEAWNKKTPIVGGRTRAQAQAEYDAIINKTHTKGKDLDGNDRAGKRMYSDTDLAEVLETMTSAYKEARDWGLAHGVFTPDDIATIDSIGYNNYVSLQSKERDPNAIDTSQDSEPLSKLEEALIEMPPKAVRSLGFAKDPTKLRRKGATTPSDNAYNNLIKVTSNYARLAAQAPVVRGVEQMYESVWNDASARSFTDQYLEDLNTPDGSHVEGIVRFRPGSAKPSRFSGPGMTPIQGWGHDKNGERIRFDYYFDNTSIQLEITRMIVQNGASDSFLARNSRTLTRGVALMLTRFNAMWNVRNVPTDFLERANTMAFRDVVDTTGTPIKGLDLQAIYTKRMATNMTPSAHSEVAEYIETGIPKTPLQRELHAAFTAGAIQLHTDVLNRSEINSGGKKSEIDKGLELVTKGASAVINSNRFTGRASGLAGKGLDKYLLHVSDVPQTISALSAYQAYIEAGVNRKEAGNRVRDQFDPARAPTRGWATALYPFFNSTTSGHYNLWRSVSQADTTGKGGAAVGKYALKGGVKTTGIIAFYMAIYAAALVAVGAAHGDDEDGVPKLASMSISSFKRGLPIPMGEEGVYYLPVGHGLPQAMFVTAASMYKKMYAKNTSADVAGDLLFTALDNTLPVQTAARSMFSEDFNTLMQGIALTGSPEAYKPLVEAVVNRSKFTGGKIVYGETPRGERASEQVKFSTPDAYVSLAQTLDSVLGIDMRPESAQHLFGSVLSYGPLRAVDAVIQDKGEKTAGLREGTREAQGFFMGLTGAGTGYDTRALNTETLMYDMMDRGYARAKKFNVPMSDPNDKGVQGIINKLSSKGADADDIAFIEATVNQAKLQAKQRKEFKGLVEARAEALAINDPVAGVHEARMIELQAEIDAANLQFVEDNNEY